MSRWLRRLGCRITRDTLLRRQVVVVPDLPPELAGLRIAHLSDFHFRRWDGPTDQARELLRRVGFDLLAVTGDFCLSSSNRRRSAALARRFFSSLRAPLGQFAVLGNHDTEDLPELLAGTPLEFLRNRCRVVQWRGVPLNIVGLDCAQYRRLERPEVAMAGRQAGAFTLVLCHYPSAVRLLAKWQVGLVLAGHTHGGQVRLPVVGCVWSHDSISVRHAFGLHTMGGSLVHVTAGIGTTGPVLVRVNCPPEVAIIELRRADEAQ